MIKMILSIIALQVSLFAVAQSKVGIGTNTPTATLDVNGNLRIRGNYPAKGASLVSMDANGTLTWQKPYAFRVEGLQYLTNESIANNQSLQILFNTITEYNIGLMYAPIASKCTAPVKGIYHFDVHISTYKSAVAPTYAKSATVTLVRNRNNAETILQMSGFSFTTEDGSNLWGPAVSHQISGDFLLEAGDELYVVVSGQWAQLIEGGKFQSSFCGRLVSQIF